MAASKFLACRVDATKIAVMVLMMLSLSSTSEGANPLARFFMMRDGNKKKDMKGGNGGSMDLAQVQCVDPQMYIEQATLLQAQLDELKQQYLAQEHLNSKRLSEVEEDLVNQIAKLSASTSKEMARAKKELAAAQEDVKVRKAALLELQTKFQDTIEIKDRLTERRVRETENLYKIEIDLVKASLKLELETVQQLADRKCSEQIEEKLAMVTVNETSSDESGSSAGNSRVKIKVLREENSALQQQKQALQEHLAALDSIYMAKYKEKEQQMKDYLVEATEEKASQICDAKIEAEQVSSERQLSAAMAMCEEESELKLEEAQAEMDLHLKKVEAKHAQRMTELTEECLEKIDQLKNESAISMQNVLEARQLEFDAAIALRERENEDLLGQIAASNRTLIELQQNRTDLALRAEQQALQCIENEAAANKTCQTKISSLQHQNAKCKDTLEEKMEALKELQVSCAALNQTASDRQKLLETCEDTKVKLKTGLEYDLQQATKSLNYCHADLAECEGEAARLKKQVGEKQEEVEYWSSVFVRRSSFNWTHAEDSIFDWIVETSQTSSELFSEQYHALVVAIEPHALPIYAWYDKHLQKHVNPVVLAVEKQYSQHATPHILKAKKAVEEAIVDVKAFCVNSYQVALSGIRSAVCPRVGKSTSNFVNETLDSICRDTSRSLARSLYMTALIMTILLRRQLVRLNLRCIWLAWQLVSGLVVATANSLWFFSPIRFFISKSKEQPSSNQTNNDIVVED